MESMNTSELRDKIESLQKELDFLKDEFEKKNGKKYTYLKEKFNYYTNMEKTFTADDVDDFIDEFDLEDESIENIVEFFRNRFYSTGTIAEFIERNVSCDDDIINDYIFNGDLERELERHDFIECIGCIFKKSDD